MKIYTTIVFYGIQGQSLDSLTSQTSGLPVFIYSIEVSADKKRILVKTTEYKAETKDTHAQYIDHAYLYSTPEQLCQDSQHYGARITKINARITKINNLYKTHQKSAQLLYKIYTQNIDFLNSKNTNKSSALK